MSIGDRKGGFIRPGYDPLLVPNAPTVGTLSNAGSGTALSLSFTAPSNVGGGAISSYTAVATDSSSGAIFVGTGTTSPVTISGLTENNTYTATVFANNAYGPSGSSAASNSAVPTLVQGQQAYTTSGTYSWVAPTGASTVSVVAVGGGGGGPPGSSAGGGGGGLGYKNSYAVTAGSSYTVVVGAGGNPSNSGADSYFVSVSVVKGGGGPYASNTGGTYTGDGGGNGGGSNTYGNTGCGGGAGGYAGDGGRGGGYSGSGQLPTAGSGGGGGGGYTTTNYTTTGGGGGVGILGQGSNGAAGTTFSPAGSGGSGGSNGQARNPSGNGGAYGGGAAGAHYGGGNGVGAGGAVRIIWGPNRAFPATNTGDV